MGCGTGGYIGGALGSPPKYYEESELNNMSFNFLLAV